MKYFLKQKKGFTLAETLIVIGLGMVVLLVLVNFFVGYSKTFRYIEANFQVAGSASLVMENLGNATRQAKRVMTSRTFSGTSYTSNATTVILEIPTVNSSGNIVSGSYDYILFYKSGSDLFMVTDPNGSSDRPAGTKKLSETVQSFAVTYNDADVTEATKIDVDITTSKTVKGQAYTQRVRHQIYLRNI